MIFRRYYILDRAVFITQVVQNRAPVFKDPKVVLLFQEKLKNVKQLHPFEMEALVILPDHLHMIIQPTAESNFSEIMHSLKSNFTKAYKQMAGLSRAHSVKFWQNSFWDPIIRNDRDFENHLHYIHFNPVKHGLVKDPRDWKESSYIQWENKGLYPVPLS